MDLDSLILVTGIITNATSFLHTIQEISLHPKYHLMENYRIFVNWADRRGWSNPNYEAVSLKYFLMIPFSLPGVALGTLYRKSQVSINNYFTHNKK